MTTSYIDWRSVIKKDRERWCEAYSTVEADMHEHVPWLARKLGSIAWFTSIPAVIRQEISEVAEYLGFSEETVLAAQVFYDEAWNTCRDYPMRGCTSLSSEAGFGRNLDYGYPENAGGMVYCHSFKVGGKRAEAEGFAGLLGWVALRSKHLRVSLNQAPCLRPIKRTRTPALLWFRAMCDWIAGYDVPSESGEELLEYPPAADCLLHAEVFDKRYIAEVHDTRIRWMRVNGKTAQANTYQLFNKQASPEWEADSEERMNAALSGRTINSGLRKAAVGGWTIDTFIMR